MLNSSSRDSFHEFHVSGLILAKTPHFSIILHTFLVVKWGLKALFHRFLKRSWSQSHDNFKRCPFFLRKRSWLSRRSSFHFCKLLFDSQMKATSSFGASFNELFLKKRILFVEKIYEKNMQTKC